MARPCASTFDVTTPPSASGRARTRVRVSTQADACDFGVRLCANAYAPGCTKRTIEAVVVEGAPALVAPDLPSAESRCGEVTFVTVPIVGRKPGRLRLLATWHDRDGRASRARLTLVCVHPPDHVY
jgi:hypothetical protein